MWIPNTHLSQPALLPRVLKFPPFYFGGIWVLALCRLALTLLTRHGDARAAKTNMRGKIFLYPEGRVVRLGCCRNSHKLMWRRGDNLLQLLLGISLTWCVDVTQSLTFPSIPPQVERKIKERSFGLVCDNVSAVDPRCSEDGRPCKMCM